MDKVGIVMQVGAIIAIWVVFILFVVYKGNK